jgi:glyoxylase-like metal-dependent hydrolase (beta-lactamase superfamily II)
MRFALPLAALALAAGTAFAQSPDLTLTRFDCGIPRDTNVNERFSDTFAFPGMSRKFVFSCYLIKHGNEYMMWDTGYGPSNPAAPKETLVQQLAKLNVKPEDIKYVGISHYHGDHIGGAFQFPNATLLIGKGEWDSIKAGTAPQGTDAMLKHWLSEGGKSEPLPNDKDVFGDGSVIIFNTPGHTPGHHSILVKLKQTGPVVLVGDAAHFHETYEADGVPWFNYDRAQTVASIERIKKLAANLKATVILQHDARDVSKLPAAPESAK